MTVRLINTTTRLPADKRLQDELLCVMAPELKDALWDLYVPFWSGDAPIDIFLVNELEDRYVESDGDGSPDTEALGVYYPHHIKFCRPVIEVCPERIMNAAKQNLVKTAEGRLGKATDKLELIRAYPALFCMVVIHELAHALMDNNRTRSRECEPWQFLASRFDQHDVDYFEKILPPGGNPGHKCEDRSYLKKLDLTVNGTMPNLIEESLATAISLRQRYGAAEQKFIEDFTSGQRLPYKAGLKWNLNLPALLTTASNWSTWKDSLFEESVQYNYPKSCSSKPCLIHWLLDKSEPPETQLFSEAEFENEFEKHAKKMNPNPPQ